MKFVFGLNHSLLAPSFFVSVLRCKKLMKQEVNKVSATPNGSVVSGGGVGSLGSPRQKCSPPDNKLHITTSLTFQNLQSEAGQGVESMKEDSSETMKRQKVTSCSAMVSC